MRIIAAGSIVVLAVLSLFVVRPVPIAELDSRTWDLLAGWAGPGSPSEQVVVVEIGEKSLEEFGRWPWPRALIGKLTRSLLDQGAAVVVLDMLFPQVDGGNDGLLAAAIAGQPVVAGYALRFAGGDRSLPCPVRALPLAIVGPNQSAETAVFHATGAVCSVAAITQAAADNGFLNAGPDRDGVMRRVPLLVESAGRYYPSLALAAVNLYRPVSALQLIARRRDVWRLRLDSRLIPLETESSLRLRFRGPRRHLPYASASDVLSGHAPAGLLRGKIAIVGGSAAGLRSPVVTPVDPAFPNVEIQATAIDNLLQGDVLHRPGDALLWELALALFAGITSTLMLAWLRAVWATTAIAALTGGVWAGCAWISANGTLVSPLPATAALASTLAVLTLIINLQEKKKAERTTKELAVATLQSLEVLKDSESRYQRLVENVNDAIIMDDCDGRLLFANRRFRDLFGLHQADVRGVALEQYVAPEWCDQVRDRHMRRMQGEAVPDRFEFEGIRSDGTRIWIEALVTPVEEEGRIIGSQAALRDTTERKRMEERYLQAQKMESVGRLAGGVAHDFNNLLTVINGYSSLMLAKLEPDERFRTEVEEIQKAGEQAAALTQKLLAFSRKQMVKPRSVDLNVLVADAEKMFERVIGEDIELITHLSPDMGPVIADPGQILQVLMNLVVNARDAMPAGGSVTVETKNVEWDGILPYVCLVVSDTGTGMSDEVKQHLFEPFFTTKPLGKGTGLGLATVYGIVHQSGGRIEVASEPGRGTTVCIYLPRTLPVPPELAGEAVVTADLRGSETVLVVEDQDAVRQFACTILESYGYRVLQSANGPDALLLAAEYSAVIHLLVTDIILPLMDGRVLAEKLKAVRPEMKVLYISGYSEERIGHGQKIEGDLAYLSKPFTSRVLAERLRKVLAAS